MTDDEARGLRAEVAALRAELELQKGIVAELLKRLYGARSEKLDTAQLLLELLGEDAPKKIPAPPAPRKGAHRRLSPARRGRAARSCATRSKACRR